MHAVADFGQRRLGEIQEIQPSTSCRSGKTFNDVGGDREGRAAQLPSQLELLEGGKCFQRNTMERDEQIVGTLPPNQCVMTQWHRTPPNESILMPPTRPA